MIIYLFKVRNSFLKPAFSVASCYKLVLLWQRRSTTRRQLQSLSDAQLLDIGISREEAVKEAGKAFWEN